MVYVSLYRKYRPQSFDEILGQSHVTTTLANAVDEDRVAHAYLFTGPRGTGKTSTARILAKALNCERGPTSRPCGQCEPCKAIAQGSSLDVIELDAASHSSVDSTREILAGVPLATAGGLRKVYVIDEVHMLTSQSFNALLKTLEEPPPHVVFVLATTEAHKVLPTIVSRTQRFDFRRVPTEVLQNHLEQVAKLEGIELDPDAAAAAARHADGSARDALSLLDQLASIGGRVTADDVEKVLGGRREELVGDLFDAIASGDLAGIFQTVGALVAQGADMRQAALASLEHARSLLLVKTAPEAEGLLDVSEEERARLAVQAEAFSRGQLLRTLDLLAQALTEMRTAPAHRLLLEIALVRAAVPDTDPSTMGFLGRIERLERRIGIDARAVQPAPSPLQPEPEGKPAGAGIARSPGASGVARQQGGPAASSQREPREQAAGAAIDRDVVRAGAVGLAHVKDAWPATLKEVSKHSKKVWGLLSPSRPLRFDEEALVIEVQSPFHRDTMREPGYRDVLGDALYAALGIRPPLVFEVRGADGALVSSGPEEGAAAELSKQALDYDDARPATREEDPIELVKKGLGAEVVEEKEG